MISATYDPLDNKIRIRSSQSLDPETYARVRKAGFIFAAKQDLFVAPAWTPEREDLAIELCGEIGDEDTSLVDRAEERAERFDSYSERREAEAHRAREAVDAIAENIPLGQPILVGHHSERHARRDAARIESGMRKSIKLWETSQYWERRAAGALRHAKYKELPGVRHRRIKGLESELRKHRGAVEKSEKALALWSQEGLTLARATALANFDHLQIQEDGKPYTSSIWSMLDGGRMTAEEARAHVIPSRERLIAWHHRWIAHLTNRLTYERAMLGESGGIVADKFAIEPGGRVLTRWGWGVVERVNRNTDGAISSVSLVGGYGTQGIETVRDYRAPDAGDVEKVKAAAKLPPIVNYRSEGCLEMTAAEWKRMTQFSGSAGYARGIETETHGAYRYRNCYRGGMPRSVFLTDAPVKERPLLAAAAAAPALPVPLPDLSAVEGATRAIAARRARTAAREADAAPFDALKERLKGGIKVVVNPDLFPTPPDLAELVVARAGVYGKTVLEPSAGTGALANAARAAGASRIICIEKDHGCCDRLSALNHTVILGDFLNLAVDESFERVLLNPPFARAQDAIHIANAFNLALAPGGRLVAIASAGVKYRRDKATKELRELISRHGSIEDLPEDSFASCGTNVRTVLVVLHKPVSK